jgi:hypothetical protein
MAGSFGFFKEFNMSMFGGSFYGGLTPQFAGYGGVVPGPSGALFPGGTPNNMNGFNTTVTGPPAGGGITPWTAPSSYYQAYAPGGQVPTVPGVPGATGGTPTNPTAGGTGNYLSNLLAQTAANPGPQIPPLPDLGIKNQAQNNLLQYEAYLQNAANADTNQRFNTAVRALQGQGTSEKQDIAFAQQEADAKNQQDVISQGLNNSTVLPSLRMGTADVATRANQRVDESVARQFIDLLGSKQVQGPNAQQLFQMLMQATSGPQQQFSGFRNGGVSYGPNLGANIYYP